MKFCVEKHLKKLKKVFEEDKIFEKKLKTSAFLCLLEILFNICRKDKKQRKWFPKEMKKKLKNDPCDIKRTDQGLSDTMLENYCKY